MGVPGQVFRQEAHILNDLFHLTNPVSLIFIEVKVIQALRDDILHRGPLIQRRRRVLEHHLDVPDHLPVQAVRNFTGNADTFIQDLAIGTGVGPDDSPADGGLTGPGFTYQREGLSLIHIEGGILDGPDQIVPFAEIDIHMLEGKQDLFPVGGHGAMLGEVGGTGIQNHTISLFTHSSPPLIC